MIRIAYVGLRYNYGKPEEGLSYEANNIEAGFSEWLHANASDIIVDFYYPDAIALDNNRLNGWSSEGHQGSECHVG
jgi:ketosteroid isomerase-like protein